MKPKKILVLSIIFVLIISLFGCNAFNSMDNMVSEDDDGIEIVRSGEDGAEVNANANLRDTVLYYQNETGYIVPVKRQIPWEEGIAKAALRNMIDSIAVREDLSLIGLEPIIPAGTEVTGMSISEKGVCKVNFTSEFLNYDDQATEENIVKAVVYTLTEFPTIDEVILMVEGKELTTMKYGTDATGPLARKDINATAQAKTTDNDVMVYYKGTTDGIYEYYVPVTVPVNANETAEYCALEKLFIGPESAGLYTDIPEGVYFENLTVRENVAYVNILPQSLDIISDQATFDKMAKNIALTVGQFDGIAYVEILIDGKTIEEAGLDIYESDTMPVFANEF